MNAAHFHLVVNHISAIVIACSVLLLLWALIRNREEFIPLAFTGFIIAAFFVFITFITGESAEHLVEHLEGFSHDAIENHEHAAETAGWLGLILGLAGISGLLLNRKNKPKTWFLYAILVFSLITLGFLVYTGYLGGLIRHTEFLVLIESDIPALSKFFT
jgi:uncharacterized membrane protein